MPEKETSMKKKPMSKINLKFLRISLKYRPEIHKLILKMRQCIRQKNTLLKTLKHRLKQLEKNNDNDSKTNKQATTTSKFLQDSCTQTEVNNIETIKSTNKSQDAMATNEISGWNVSENGEIEKSIAEQVKEVAQSALKDTGMVYVESAGMYYDYKTGYYYNSELGLYYHPDTGCYYYYSDEKKFVFHSYPDMSKVNASLIAHQNKKARKLKRERKPEDDIENLTKNLSQDKEEDGGKPKKARKNKKDKKKKEEDTKHNFKEDKDVTEVKTAEKKESDVPVPSDNKVKISSIIEIKNENLEIKSCDTDVDMFEVSEKIEVGEKDLTDADKKKESLMEEKEADTKEKEKKEVEKREQMEDGECSDSGSEDSDSESESDASTSSISDEDSVAKHHPPCMRVIVRETKLPKLKVGSLFLITKDGGTIGREGEQHAIILKDHNVSRNHLDIRYDMARKTYVATDLGSKNGTILNGVRMSESQDISMPLDILHGSTIQLGETKLLCHIHPGHTTCGQCEPGLLMQAEEEKKVAYTRTVSVKKQHELELARLKNIYAPQYLAIEEKPYNDRAQARREAVGSTNHAEKTQSTDLNTSIAPDNKGFKLLQKMGWSKGEGLGKDSQGDTEPVPLVSNEGKAGLGTAGAVAPPSNTSKPRVIKNNIASGTMRLATRTNMLRPPAKAFQNDDDDEDLE